MEEKKEKIEITKDMVIAELVEKCPDKVNLLMEAGMHCVTCPAALGETIEEACMVHGIDVNEMLLVLNSEE